jgi:hypothetical protein
LIFHLYLSLYNKIRKKRRNNNQMKNPQKQKSKNAVCSPVFVHVFSVKTDLSSCFVTKNIQKAWEKKDFSDVNFDS